MDFLRKGICGKSDQLVQGLMNEILKEQSEFFGLGREGKPVTVQQSDVNNALQYGYNVNQKIGEYLNIKYGNKDKGCPSEYQKYLRLLKAGITSDFIYTVQKNTGVSLKNRENNELIFPNIKKQIDGTVKTNDTNYIRLTSDFESFKKIYTDLKANGIMGNPLFQAEYKKVFPTVNSQGGKKPVKKSTTTKKPVKKPVKKTTTKKSTTTKKPVKKPVKKTTTKKSTTTKKPVKKPVKKTSTKKSTTTKKPVKKPVKKTTTKKSTTKK